jgi:hypothetical protein
MVFPPLCHEIQTEKRPIQNNLPVNSDKGFFSKIQKVFGK